MLACSIATIWPFMLASSAAVCLSPPTKNAAGQNTTIAAAVTKPSFVRWLSWAPESAALAAKYPEPQAPAAGSCRIGTRPAKRTTARYLTMLTHSQPTRRQAPRFLNYAFEKAPRPKTTGRTEPQPLREINRLRAHMPELGKNM